MSHHSRCVFFVAPAAVAEDAEALLKVPAGDVTSISRRTSGFMGIATAIPIPRCCKSSSKAERENIVKRDPGWNFDLWLHFLWHRFRVMKMMSGNGCISGAQQSLRSRIFLMFDIRNGRGVDESTVQTKCLQRPAFRNSLHGFFSAGSAPPFSCE